MSVITSKESKTFKELQRLTQKKYRDREGLFIAEGPNVVGEALNEDRIEVRQVFAREGSDYEQYTEGTIVLSEKLFDSVSDTMTNQGLIAVIRKPDRGSAENLLSRISGIKAFGADSGSVAAGDIAGKGIGAKAADASGDVIILDRLQDPGNIGTILRTAEGAGIRAAIFIKGTCDPYSPKVVRACAGSILRMPIAFCESAEEAITIAHNCGYRLAVTDVRHGVPYYDAGLSGRHAPIQDRTKMEHVTAQSTEANAPKMSCSELEQKLEQTQTCDGSANGSARSVRIALVIGNEGNGVSDVFREAADILVNIPMQGRLESLNASVAAALLMYEMARPRDK
ncbi:MAG: RNA methyltransferase [Eubacterium sp.]|nr:RNA methyltransferase [Eubacterium sp.]